MRFWKLGAGLSLLVLLVIFASGKLNQTIASSPVVNGCPIFPANNIWNTPINTLPVDPNSNAYINSIGASTGLHPDFGSGLYDGFPIGIPFTSVPNGQTKVPVSFDYADESDPGPYPIPPNAPVEGDPNGSGDRHVLVIEQGSCKLYEMYASVKQTNNSWEAGSGAVYDLSANLLRPAGWTSADAAGLPILPGLVRYDEVAAGSINHALRFTVDNTRNSFIWPARHQASYSANANYPPMGQRFRLKANFNISTFPADVRVILTALKTYGMFVADNGSNWYISGAPDNRWDNDSLHLLQNVPGSAFEAVNESSLQINPSSAQAKSLIAAINPVGGTPQGAVVNTSFLNPFKVLVTDFARQPFSGATVTFTVATTSPAGTFAGSVTSYQAATNSSGIATASLFTANGLTGSYTVTAAVSGVSTPAVFQLKNLDACSQPFIVTMAGDSGAGTECGSLSRALLQGGPGITIGFNAGISELSVSGTLPPVQAGVILDGGHCDELTGPAMSIKGVIGSGQSPGLVVQSGAKVQNIRVYGFPGPQIRVSGGRNLFYCVIVSKA